MGAPKRTPAQNSRMWGLVSALAKATGSSREEAKGALRRHCMAVSGQDHSSHLTRHQARQVIDRLQAELNGTQQPEPARREPWGDRGPGPRTGQSITHRQLDVLERLYHQAGLDTKQRQMGFAKRQCGVPWPQTQAHYDSIYGGLEAMVLRQADPGDIWRRCRNLVGNPGLNAWQVGFVDDMCRQFSEAHAEGSLSGVLSPHKIAKVIEAESRCGVER